MAAGMALLDNLKRTLEKPETIALSPLKREQNRLRELVRRLQGAIIALESGDYVDDDLRRGRLENISTSLYEVDDLVDQILTFEHRGQVNFLPHLSFKQFFFTGSVAKRVGEISNYIESLVGQLLNEVENRNQPDESQLQPKDMPWFIPAEYKLIGRENDKNYIVNMFQLRKPKDRIGIVSVLVNEISRLAGVAKSAHTKYFHDDHKVKSWYDLKMLFQTPKESISNVTIIWMSGVTGVGKSALAKDIFEDDKVKSHFDLRMWLHVSQVTDETDIIREIVDSCTNRRSNYNENSRNNQNDRNSFQDLLGCRSSNIDTDLHNNTDNNAHQNEIDIYERRLKNEIKGKVYLLVLDDVCLQKWQRLIDLLAGGGKGSHILVTSQAVKVADLSYGETPEVKEYSLQGLTEEHSWNLFERIAFKYDPESNAKKTEMKTRGFKIAELCDHIPFTIKVSASFIHGKQEMKWLEFIKHLRLIKDQKEELMERVLHHSLSDLPTHLRACFGYCSLFPDDFNFNKHDLISLWIAQGFVCPQPDQSLQEVGEMYFKELSRRCFVEKESKDDFGKILTCKMHHIVRSLALKLTAGVANIHVTDSWIREADPTLKHIFVNCQGDLPLKLSSPLPPIPSLRTLILVKEPGCDIKVDTFVCNQLICTYNRLRVLDLHDLGLKELPDSICEQIHLRYLDLSRNDGLVALPKSFTRLRNLQTLKLNLCRNLKMLPSDFGLLVNLQRLEVDECDRLTCMPVGLEKLTQLERLSRFVVGKVSSIHAGCAGLEALTELKLLRGRLAIEFTGDYPPEVAGGWMRNKSKLRQLNIRELNIRWAQKTSYVAILSEESRRENIEAHEKILEHLQPNKDLKTLSVEGYKGGQFPRWARADKLATSLPNLVILSIEGCGKCEFLPPFGELPNLRKLILRHMTNVQYVEEPPQGSSEGSQDLPLFKSLEELTLHNFNKLEGWRKKLAKIQQPGTRTFPRLSKLRIWNCPNLRSLPSFPEVKELKLRNVHQLLLDDCARKASSHQNITGTERLQIKGCPNLEGFEVVSVGLGGLPSLKHLVIDKCDALSSLASDLKNISSLETLRISSCKELDLSQVSHSTYNVFLSSPWKRLEFLRELTLIDIPKMEILPDGLRHVKSLKMLCIAACQSLKSLPDWIGDLSSLQHLRIESCYSLKMLPQGIKDINNLLKVEIIECSEELMKRCQEPNGEDWPYIKHAQVVVHKSWRYGYVSHQSSS